jgi:hypothetical protein
VLLKAIGNDGSLTGTGTLTCESRIMGGVLITADGTNNATVIARRLNSAGKIVFKIVTKSPLFTTGPIGLEDTQALYYDVSGTGAAAQFFEWVE